MKDTEMLLRTTNSNTTLVKVKFFWLSLMVMVGIDSNTTLVKVKYMSEFSNVIKIKTIQIQHLLKLNLFK